MKKCVHLTAGDIYLVPSGMDESWENCDIVGKLAKDCIIPEIAENATTLDLYFKKPFEKEAVKRPIKTIIVDTKMNILETWPWADNSVAEIVQVNSLEHFWHNREVPFIVGEAYRVLKRGGVWKFDFPDIKKIVELYHDTDPDFCMKLIYGSRKNDYSCHEFGYTKQSILDYFYPLDWSLEFREVVTHSYPSQGVWATKI